MTMMAVGVMVMMTVLEKVRINNTNDDEDEEEDDSNDVDDNDDDDDTVDDNDNEDDDMILLMIRMMMMKMIIMMLMTMMMMLMMLRMTMLMTMTMMMIMMMMKINDNIDDNDDQLFLSHLLDDECHLADEAVDDRVLGELLLDGFQHLLQFVSLLVVFAGQLLDDGHDDLQWHRQVHQQSECFHTRTKYKIRMIILVTVALARISELGVQKYTFVVNLVSNSFSSHCIIHTKKWILACPKSANKVSKRKTPGHPSG